MLIVIPEPSDQRAVMLRVMHALSLTFADIQKAMKSMAEAMKVVCVVKDNFDYPFLVPVLDVACEARKDMPSRSLCPAYDGVGRKPPQKPSGYG